jgi:GDSL-like lipase/acylhydrolase family protein
VRQLFYQFLVFAVLIIVGEIFLWIFCSINLEQEEVIRQDLPGVKRLILYQRNRYGLRALSMRDNAKPKNLIRVLCLGASTTEQTTQETKDTWCGALETKFKTYYHNLNIQIQTTAFGFGGAKALDDALWLYENIDTIKPDVVITLLGVNDLAWNGGPNYKARGIENIRQGIEKIQQAKTLRGFKEKCKEYSQICRRIVTIMRNLEIRRELRNGEAVEWHTANLAKMRKKYQGLPYVEELIRNPDPLTEFREVMQWLVSYFKQQEVPVILLAQPVLWKKTYTADEFNVLWFSVNTPNGPVRASGSWLYTEMQRYNLVQKNLANEPSIMYVDLDKEIPKNLKYFFDDCHFTDFGSVSVADVILPTLINAIDSVVLKNGIK